MDRAKIVDFYLQKINEKDFDISQVRKDLEKNNIAEEDIKAIVRLVDNELQKGLVNKPVSMAPTQLIIFGGIITAAGLIITIGTFTGLIDMGNSFLIAYGPILGGISLLLSGLAKRK